MTGTEWLCVVPTATFSIRKARSLGDDRPRPRRLRVVEDAEVDVDDRGAAAARLRAVALDHEDGRPQLEVVPLRDLVELVAPAAGRDPDGRRDVGPPDTGAHAAHRGGGPQLGLATNSVGRTTSEGGAPSRSRARRSSAAVRPIA